MLRRNFIAARDLEAELEQWQERIDIIRHKLKFIRQLPGVACIEQLNPLSTAGGRIPALVEIAGGTAIASEENGLLFPPDIVILMQPGKNIEESLREIGGLLDQPWFAESPALKNNRVYVADCREYFQLPGPGMIDSLEILAEIINAGDFHFGFEGRGWIKFESGSPRN